MPLEPAVRNERPGWRSPSAQRSGSSAPVRSAATTRSATAGPCLKPWPEPPPTIQTDGSAGWGPAMKLESADSS